MFKRIILVAAAHRHHLEEAVKMAVRGGAFAAGMDIYERVKTHLRAAGVPHEDKTANPAQVVSGNVYWHA